MLFVDDDPLALRAFQRTLRQFGYDADLVQDAPSALDAVRRQPYTVIFTDLDLGSSDGYALIEQLSSVNPSAQFVVLTGSALELRANASVDGSIVGILQKPWHDEELVHVLEVAADLSTRVARGSIAPAESEARSILLVEDSPSDVAFVRALLDEMGFRGSVDHVSRLEDALEWLHEHECSLIVADLSLPDARGLDCVMRLQSACADAAILVLTGTDSPDVGLQAIRHGAVEFVSKHDLDAEGFGRALCFARERREATRRLARLAYFDQLTGLANRVTLRDRLQRALFRHRRGQVPFTLLAMDLDGFKAVNDTLGHDAGDQLLQRVSRRLERVVREYDTVARLGGDEFAVLLEGADQATGVEVASRIVALVAEPFELEAATVRVSASVGVAELPTAATELDALMRRADEAMYRSKGTSKGGYVVAPPADGAEWTCAS